MLQLKPNSFYSRQQLMIQISSTCKFFSALIVVMCKAAGHLVSYYKDVITASGSSKQVLKNRLDKIIHAVEIYSDFVKPFVRYRFRRLRFIDYIKTLDKFSSVTGLENSLD